MANAALEAAVWDAEAKQEKVPLSKLIGGVREEIACGVSVGIKESPDELAAAVQKELAAGYQRIKIKIKPERPGAGATPAPGFSAHQADGRCQLCLRAEGLAALQAIGRLLPDDDRTAPRVGRSLQPHRAAEKAGHPDLPGRVRSYRRTGAGGHRVGRLQDHQH